MFVKRYDSTNTIMMSDIELETSRLVFEIERELLLSQFREMIEKTMRIENALSRMVFSKNVTQSQEQFDSYSPPQDFACPPKKKTRFQ